MKKSDLKQLIKPLVKECIHEVLIEEGVLSNIVSEVAQGMQTRPIVESQAPKATAPNRAAEARKMKDTRQKMNARRKELMDSIGKDAYNGVDLFEGTAPMTREETKGAPAGSVDLGNSSDAGVDISSLVGGASHVWNAMK
jgi:hypothetical protein